MMTSEQVDALCRPFSYEAHEWVKGRGGREYVYLTEFAICSRLDEVDPNWSFVVTDRVEREYTITREKKDGGSYTLSGHELAVTVALTVCGVTRYGIGMADVAPDAAEADKSAVTDALKRAARLFGVGRYLLSDPAPKGQAFRQWLDAMSVAGGRAVSVAIAPSPNGASEPKGEPFALKAANLTHIKATTDSKGVPYFMLLNPERDVKFVVTLSRELTVELADTYAVSRKALNAMREQAKSVTETDALLLAKSFDAEYRKDGALNIALSLKEAASEPGPF